jgi:hypothetical protein
MKPIISFFVFLISVAMSPNQEDTVSNYKVTKLSSPPQINAVWEKTPWNDIEPVQLALYMGDKPEHFPYTEAKMAYDDEAIYIIFRVEDRYVKAVHNQNQDPVCKDSCVEFFFSPENDVKDGYFNLEMNCGGTMLFNHQIKRQTDVVLIRDSDIQKIKVAHSLPKIIEQEINKKTTWVVEYRIPFSILSRYQIFSKPKAGTVWKANFYKCGDRTSHPHWLTWAPVDYPKPNFHLPEYFGTLEFQ